VLFCGVSVEDRLILRLATVVTDVQLASKLSMAYTFRSEVLNLSFAERQVIVGVLENQPAGLEALYEQLVGEPAWNVRQRL
jgi:hypothetical protein